MAANTFTEAGYTFAGWSDGSATYAAGATYTLASNGSAIVLTATWTANATDDYSYAAGTGSGTAPAAGSGLDGTPITLAANTFTEAGYTFAGWSDGSATYAAGATYTLASNGSAIVLTATWTANATDDYSYAAGTGTRHRPGRGQRPRRHHRSPWPPTPSPRRATPSPGGATAAPPTPPAPPTPWPPTARPSS